MSKLPKQVTEFLSCKRIAVAGVSRDARQPANAIYRKLRGAGYQVFAVNPQATEVEGDPCYPDLHAVPQPLEAVVIVTPANAAAQVVQECAALGIGQVWLHRSFGDGSVSAEAVRECERLGINCLVGGCPMMYCEPVDFGHRCMRWVLKLQKRVPV
ncbi:MAG: CoA-binding protein [Acidobacteria bacterium]|nr:CoA-binding protein [Acidobacteriota bacterium]MBI3427180.1 CoA-binding protein [Acidobacteriota bacterium]